MTTTMKTCKSNRYQTPSAQYPILRIWISAGLGALSLILLHSAQSSVKFSNWYSEHIYSLLVVTFGRLFGLFSFSVVEIGLYITILILLFSFLRAIYLHRLDVWKCFGGNLLLFAAILFFLYTMCCGINYGRSSFSETTGITTETYTVEELASVCKVLTAQVNQLAPQVSRAEDGTALMGDHIPENAVSAMKHIGTIYPELSGYYPNPKGLTFPWILSVQNLSGIYSPFTIEANYNSAMTEYNLPFTACHELSHLRGFMQEEEANFIAFLSCVNADNEEFQYSGYLFGWLYATNQLYRTDYTAYQEIYSTLDDRAKTDLNANNLFWDKYDGRIAEVSSQINDSYLKANGQSEGVQSYDRMVDLIMAYYR